MQAKTLTSSVQIDGNVLNYTVRDKVSGESVTVPFKLAEIYEGFDSYPNITKLALIFSTRTKARNGTGGLSLEEAAQVVNATADQLHNQDWVSATRQSSGETKHSLLARAIAEAMGIEPAQALAIYNSKVEETAKAYGIDPEADDDDTIKNLRKVTSAVRAKFRELPQVDAAYLRIKLADDQAKAEAAAKRAASAGDVATIGAVTVKLGDSE